MSLSCGCYDWDGNGWYYRDPTETTLQTSKRKRCCSCQGLIDIGATVVKFPRYRSPNSDIEESIHGDEVKIADWYMCEECGDLYWSLEELGYCIYLGNDSMQELVEQHNNIQRSYE